MENDKQNKEVKSDTEKTKATKQDIEAEAEGFIRRPRVMRSPVTPSVNPLSRGRIGSFSGLEEMATLQLKHDLEQVQQTWKRKRLQDSPDKIECVQAKNHAAHLMKTLDQISLETKKLANVLKDMYHPKTGIKNGVINIMKQLESVYKEDFQKWIQNLAQTEIEQEECILKKENAKLRNQITNMEEQHKKELETLNTKLNNEKCEECRLKQLREAKRRAFRKIDTYENFQAIEDEIWQEGILQRTLDGDGAIWEAPKDCALLLPCNKKFQGFSKQAIRAINKYGGFSGLKTQNKAKGELAMMVHSLGYPDGNGRLLYESREIFYPIFTDEGGIDQALDECIFQSLRETKKQALDRNLTHIAFPEIQGVSGTIMDRMIEFLFYDTNIELIRYKQAQSGEPENTKKNNKTGQPPVQPPNYMSKPKRINEEAILVKAEGKTYSDMLKKLKTEVNTDNIGIEIQHVRKTQKGDLLITVKRDTKKIEALKREIDAKAPEATTTILTRKTVIHVKDLDEVTTESDIGDAIMKVLPLKKEDFEVRALRPTNMGRQNATIILTEPDARQLLSIGKLKIGWINCRLLERKKERRCPRCWKTGHTKVECKGPDRQDLCMKCSKKGHRSADCRNKPFCLHCNKEGHQTGSNKCPAEVEKNNNQNEVSTD